MSHSRIFDNYAKIMSDKGFVKIAAEKDKSYNVVPEKVGPGSLDDENGWELTEFAHPDQIQVSRSQLEDGVVENGVEIQKTMTDIARRNPRGVLASLMKTLVKAANVLEEDLSDESLMMAAQIDSILISLAQSQVVLNDRDQKLLETEKFDRLRPAIQNAWSSFNDLNWSPDPAWGLDKTVVDRNGAGSGYTMRAYGESVVKDALKKLELLGPGIGEGSVSAAQKLAQYVNQSYAMVVKAIQQSKDGTFSSSAKDNAMAAWAELKNASSQWLGVGNASKGREDVSQVPPGIARMDDSAGVALKAPVGKKHLGQTYSFAGPVVKELQELLGVTEDGKFGPQTYKALKDAATKNTLLSNLIEESPKLAEYKGWDPSSVGQAVLRIHQANGETKPSNKNELMPSPYTKEYEQGFRAANNPDKESDLAKQIAQKYDSGATESDAYLQGMGAKIEDLYSEYKPRSVK